MLYQVSLGIEGKDIYATLYAQKMFFVVEVKQREVSFEVIPYLDARNQSELNLQRERREGSEDYPKWENLFRQTFYKIWKFQITCKLKNNYLLM